ncbi:hypothetical protein GSI_07180 [Ganoderma sinense ZZ0214-1]|uniref:Uncharacterized protein n=1 Tax=Ganoderma sinense ZZ0214-1 TaxID=1077348 RepID=A0A2G8S9P5_9APHY|nr:hypothetical protein GSI_07180 [Ganoderma sinense ZZ0214-1]
MPSRARSRQPTPAPSQSSPASRQSTPARQPTPGPSTTEDSTDPQPPCRQKTVRFPSVEPDDDNDEQDDREVDTAKVATPDGDGLISKPEGEVGRRKRGYSLRAVLGWSPTLFKSTKDLVLSYVEDYLHHSLSTSHQPQGDVDSLIKLIQARHPGIVDLYRDGWPIRDMIYLRLKYTSSRFKCGQVVPQGKKYPQDLKKALKEAERNKGKQRAMEVS